MSVILNIETSSKNCSVCLSSKGNLVTSFDLEDEAYRHSELLTSSIQNILSQNNLDVSGLSAVSVGIGPGSFTGLRIGLSVAKGLCYPHNINLIGISSLKIIANSVINENKNIISLIKDKGQHYYISKYSNDLKEVVEPKIKLIDRDYIFNILDDDSVIVVNTDESNKFISDLVNEEIQVFKRTISSIDMISLSHKSLEEKKFEDIAYIEPMYVKKPYVN
ncbi:tRNA (adenosine(37)-N6)-threonylcarbamoyltransferase complex dimerization subunit type 1 TsaB [Flavobacteriaceae bacterium]|nr:tRNA (adenosine(37)-N6)-threonylcarbamoyltransferase complex dimerization subunit type 1 TsaB [Flavobacteriaceae bacterium]|tara:strand:- start:204 stop:863 length:660 start_codon:yes stop_codon:yes gene_type:complete